ncbi:MAG: inner membrane protein, partial [Patescibacteria group bacterium]|nr:inner membrane protein [Patescibacteria group bacterium]
MENPITAVTNVSSKNGPIFKILLCGFLGLLLLIPASMIEDLVSGRNQLKIAATNEISSKWGSSTTLAGPVLSIPYSAKEDQVVAVGNGIQTVRTVSKTRYLHILPNDLSYDTSIEPSVRSRGIYDVVVYRSSNSVKGSFELSDIAPLFEKRGTPDYAHAIVTLGFSDSKGIENIGKLGLGGKEFEFVPGSAIRGVLPNGTSATVDLSAMSGSVAFSTDVSVRGSEWIKYLPLGKSTVVKTSSAWANPSFDGAFLPTERKVDDKGFSAVWKVLDYNRDFPQYWDDDAYSLGYVNSGVAYDGGDSWDPYGNTRMKYATPVSESGVSASVNLGSSAFGVSLKQ